MGTVDALAPGGRALIRDAGAVLFARGALPGERVEVAVERTARGVRHGVVLRVLERSPQRVEPDCPAHGTTPGTCGGCDLLHCAPAAARALRERIVDDVLVRVGRLAPDLVAQIRRPLTAPSAGDDPLEALRRRVRVVIRDKKPTFSSPESHARVHVERCAALHPVLNEGLARLADAGLADGTEVRLACDDRGHRSAALERARPGDARRVVDAGAADGAVLLRPPMPARSASTAGSARAGRGATDDADAASVEHERTGDPVLQGEVAPGFHGTSGPARSDAGVFTQATRFGGRAILRAVLEAAAPAPGDRVLELFAGSGHLTLPMLCRGAHVHAVEGAPRGVEFLERNVADFAAQCTTRRAFIDGDLRAPEDVDVIVADPPRTGIPGFAAILSRFRAARLVLVSCDPATGARDLAIARAAGYVVQWLEPIDAFPRTSHVEWVANLRRPA